MKVIEPKNMKSKSILLKISEISLKKNIPVYSIFELTRNCNLDCRHCYIDKNINKETKDLSLVEVEETLSELKKMKVLFITFTGGEIFLRKDIFDIFEFAKKLNFYIRIFTNGTLITKEIAHHLKKFSITVDISIYGDEKFHNHITRNRYSYKLALEGIENLLKKGIKPTIKTPIFRNKIKQIYYIREFSKKLGLNHILDPVISGEKKKKYLINKKENKEIKKIIYPFNSGNKSDFFCGAGRTIIAIDAKGNILPCLAMDYKLGNVKKDNISVIWQKSEKINYLRTIDIKDTECFNCPDISSCIRCPGIVIEEKGNILSKSDSACNFVKA